MGGVEVVRDEVLGFGLYQLLVAQLDAHVGAAPPPYSDPRIV